MSEMPKAPNKKPMPKPMPKPKPKPKFKAKVEKIQRGILSPQAIDLEKAIIGSLLIDKKAIKEVIGILEPEVFYKEAHRDIFKAILHLYDKNIGIDILTVSEYLRSKILLDAVGGDFYLIGLVEKISSSAHIEYHSRIVLQKYILRQLIKISAETLDTAYSVDPDAIFLIDKVTQNINHIKEIAIREQIGNVELHFEKEKKELYEKVGNNNKGVVSGILFGMSEFDGWCGGIQDTDLVTIAARPSMGKSTAVISIAYHNSFTRNIPVALFSLEMSSIIVKNKITAGVLNIPYTNIRQGRLNSTQLSKVLHYYDVLNKSKLHIVDTSIHKNNFEKIEERIRSLVINDFVKLVIIDYVQLIMLTKSLGGDTTDLMKITRSLKALANEIQVPIVILSQLNRKVDDRPGHVPILSDLKQSGTIEEDSDMVIFLLRQSYYDMIGKPDLVVPNDELFKTLFIVAKGRHTGVKTFTSHLDFIKSKMVSFCDKDI